MPPRMPAGSGSTSDSEFQRYVDSLLGDPQMRSQQRPAGSGSTSDLEFQRYSDSLGGQPRPAGSGSTSNLELRQPMSPSGALPGGAGTGSTTGMEKRAYQRYIDAIRTLQQAEQQPVAWTGSPADSGRMDPLAGPPPDPYGADYTTPIDPEFSRRVAKQNRDNMMGVAASAAVAQAEEDAFGGMHPDASAPVRKFLRGMEEKTQGPGSPVQRSRNINGEPHRLAYINPSEERLLGTLGGSGRKIDGIPAYFVADSGDEDDAANAANTAANAAAVAQAEEDAFGGMHADDGSAAMAAAMDGGPGDISPTDPDVQLYSREFAPISPYRGNLPFTGIGTRQQAGMHMEDVPPDQFDLLGRASKLSDYSTVNMAAQLLGRLAEWGGFPGTTQTADEALAEQEAMAVDGGDDYYPMRIKSILRY